MHTREQKHHEPAPHRGLVCLPNLSLGEGFLCDTINITLLMPFLFCYLVDEGSLHFLFAFMGMDKGGLRCARQVETEDRKGLTPVAFCLV